MRLAGCPLCDQPGGELVVQARQFRVIRALEPGFPAFYRVVWNDHVAEFTDLSVSDRAVCMEAVAGVEQAIRTHLQPTKVNLAALGNMVPHLHWHVVARFDWDSHFPSPVWAAATREAAADRLADLAARLPKAQAAMVADLGRR
jgi:diadenosine tetraphosphate (Ap4A) HIT family hydrolase